mmetsp:Transcript_5816/g.12682  ORF Transcript_5816/g.12682 Transcript_5816/m.12682 type:complete len:489 (+) Transcript_5816:61-1527(+)
MRISNALLPVASRAFVLLPEFSAHNQHSIEASTSLANIRCLVSTPNSPAASVDKPVMSDPGTLSYFVIKISDGDYDLSSSDKGTWLGVEEYDSSPWSDSLLVKRSDKPGFTQQIAIILNAHEYESMMAFLKTSFILPANKLFTFPLSNDQMVEWDDCSNDKHTTQIATVLEANFSSEEARALMESYGRKETLKVSSFREVYHLFQNNSPLVQKCHLCRFILKLYLQHSLDSCIPGRRLLRGTSGSDLDLYTLRPKPAVIFFDCDDCLYFDNWKIAAYLTTKIEKHCQTEFGLDEGYAYKLYKKHGTALRGLIAEGYLSRDCSKSIDGFLETVHDLPIHALLSPDEQLRDMISKIHPSIRKFVFTASVRHHAERCLDALGISDLFDGIIDVKDCQFETKHSESSFHIAMGKAGVDNPESCIFVDDSVTNISAGRRVGWRCILVGKVGRDCGKKVTTEHAEHEIDTIHHLPHVLPEIFLPTEKSDQKEKD